jgi:N-formylglutamate amidohydrolase
MSSQVEDVPAGRPVFDVKLPINRTGPVVFASPHSGTDYRQEFFTATKLDTLVLRRSEDSFVDELFAGAPSRGVPLIRALFPRVFIDPNREPYELDPTMFVEPLPAFVNVRSPRVGAGLGTIARVVANGAEVYFSKLPFAEAQRRVETFYKPYHARLAGLIDETVAAYGGSIFIDCHSMPSVGGPMDRDPGKRRVDFVLGDCHGTSCAPALIDAVERHLRARGHSVTRNTPYAGGFCTQHYGRPKQRRHALQIEMNRALYMDELRIERNAQFAAVAAEMTGLIDTVVAASREIV